ncbi:tRNA (N(6)-L-threonylcarbamoyladenosine(37)-C(2))-methylthiotransferase MtaB [Bacteroidota bacterium]|nr:tRNA (N(6)-L-threonylcarbamoyladenosine(37)-C(2))-methylthiotransferase MtaB [Bacteroidota bacterium]
MTEKSKTIAYHTLGCKLNFAETSTIARNLEKEGYNKVKFDDAANIYLINTCSVTENADKETRTIVKRALRNSPDAKIVVVGCYAQLKPEEIASIEGVDLVVGTNDKFNLAKYFEQLPEEKVHGEKAVFFSCDISEVNFFKSSYSLGERTRAFLKVQDGCDYSCTYCTIPLARGKSRSDSTANVVIQAKELEKAGVKEIVLTGVNIGDFGINAADNSRNENFFELIQALDAETDIDRFRISSIEPNLLKDEMIDFVSKSKSFMPHFHIPLQSGSDEVLKNMKRRYLRDTYVSRVEKIKSVMPHACIGVDVIVGFPGETDELFNETVDFLLSLDVSYLHVFTYSERANTEAALMTEKIPMRIRQERNKILRQLSEKKRNHFYAEHIGTTRIVLFESDEHNGLLEGFSDNYIKVKVPYHSSLINNIFSVKLISAEDDYVIGEIISGDKVSTTNTELTNHF